MNLVDVLKQMDKVFFVLYEKVLIKRKITKVKKFDRKKSAQKSDNSRGSLTNDVQLLGGRGV